MGSCIGLSEVEGVMVGQFLLSKCIQDDDIEDLNRELTELQELHDRKLILDLKVVRFLSSSSLERLVALNKRFKGSTGRLVFCGVFPDVMEVFKITRLTKLFDIKSDREEALKAINRGWFSSSLGGGI